MRSRPYEFFTDYLLDQGLELIPKAMFGCIGLYNGHTILVVLRDKDDPEEDRGIWICTSFEHHKSLERDLEDLRYISTFGNKSRWLLLPEDSPSFEENSFKLADFILEQDKRIGREGKIKVRK